MTYALSMNYRIAVPLSWPSISAGPRLPVSLSLKDVSLTRLAKNRRRIFALRCQRDIDKTLICWRFPEQHAKIAPKRCVTEYSPSESPPAPLARDRPAQIVLPVTSLAEDFTDIVSQKCHPFWPLTLW